MQPVLTCCVLLVYGLHIRVHESIEQRYATPWLWSESCCCDWIASVINSRNSPGTEQPTAMQQMHDCHVHIWPCCHAAWWAPFDYQCRQSHASLPRYWCSVQLCVNSSLEPHCEHTAGGNKVRVSHTCSKNATQKDWSFCVSLVFEGSQKGSACDRCQVFRSMPTEHSTWKLALSCSDPGCCCTLELPRPTSEILRERQRHPDESHLHSIHAEARNLQQNNCSDAHVRLHQKTKLAKHQKWVFHLFISRNQIHTTLLRSLPALSEFGVPCREKSTRASFRGSGSCSSCFTMWKPAYTSRLIGTSKLLGCLEVGPDHSLWV